jgi:hypothetical protein
MDQIDFEGNSMFLNRVTNDVDTKKYDRPDIDEPKGSAIWVNPVGFNVLSHRRERRSPLATFRLFNGIRIHASRYRAKGIPIIKSDSIRSECHANNPKMGNTGLT